ncbi:AsnC family transcriptional regulator [bacterium]|nr:AsnC family transcriptional regulator [bacterium]|tara:strand:- start:15172 stop:15498 length:327 start_codon:yes stop_codon:yes gene_type:complete
MSQSKNERVRALVELEVRPEEQDGFDRAAGRIFRHNNVIDHYLISGRYDFLIILESDSISGISEFVSNQLAPLKSIRSITTHFILKRYKVNGILLDDPNTRDRLSVTP